MKKERFFRLLGDLDDHILDKYREMDAQLSHKALRKKRALRVLLIAACLALLIGACVPVGMMIAQLGKGPSDPLPSITLQSLAELETMREMVTCEDEQVLQEYLHSITGGGAQSRQDLIDFLNLVDNTPYAPFIDGEITDLTYNKTDERFSVSVEAENGESMYVSYELGMTDVEKNMEKAAKKLGRKNLLSAPLSGADGRLTLYTETREPSANGDVIRWQGVLDGIAVYIVYRVADADRIDTASLVGSLEVADSIAPAFPQYTWTNTTFGAFVENPEYEKYCGVYESYSDPAPVWVNQEGYVDPDAPLSYFANDLFSAEIGSLSYEGTWPQTLEGQAAHVYKIVENGASYTVYLDATTGVLMGWEIGGKTQTSIATSEQEMMDLAYAYLASYVRDPRAYTSQVTKEEGYTICSYVRYVGSMQTCDALTAYFDSEGALDSIIWGYLGAFRNLEEVPNELIDTVRADLTEMGRQYADTTEIKIKGLHIAPDGRVALDCSLIRPEVEYQYLAYLTEAKGAQETEPVTTEPVTTQPPRETESQWNPDEIPDFVKLGYLNVLIYDENDELIYRMNAEKLKAIDGELSVGYVSGGTVVVECYAAYDRSGRVARYRIDPGTIQWIEASAIKSDVTVDVDADYYHYLRIVIPMDELTVGEMTGVYLIGDYSDSSIEGWALWEILNVYADETPPDQDVEITGPTETTESDTNKDLPAQFLRAGILSIDFQDENGVVSSVISEDEIGGFNGILELEEIPRGDFIVDFYACFNQSNNVTFSVVMPDGVILEPLDESSIKGRLPWKPWETNADYVLGFRIVIPREVLEIGNRGAMVFLNPEDVQQTPLNPVIQVWFDIKNS